MATYSTGETVQEGDTITRRRQDLDGIFKLNDQFTVVKVNNNNGSIKLDRSPDGIRPGDKWYCGFFDFVARKASNVHNIRHDDVLRAVQQELNNTGDKHLGAIQEVFAELGIKFTVTTNKSFKVT
jgi:hypothetical protein